MKITIPNIESLPLDNHLNRRIDILNGSDKGNRTLIHRLRLGWYRIALDTRFLDPIRTYERVLRVRNSVYRQTKDALTR